MTPTITAVIAAYNSEPWLGESLEAVLGQTRPPDEVVVVDDGSTDGTPELLRRFGDAIRVVRQPNGGCPAAFNRAFREARGDYVAMCAADDVWEPRKLEWQAETIAAHPSVDVLFGDAVIFGLVDGRYGSPPGDGVLDHAALRDALYHENLICAPTIMIRRELFERLGPFVENFGADDYEYWMRCLRADATFFYDPRVLVRYRRHESNLSSRMLWMQRCSHDVHRWYADLMEDDSLVEAELATDLYKIGRSLVDESDPRGARTAFKASLRHRIAPRPLAWTAVLALPAGARQRAGQGLVALTRARRATMKAVSGVAGA
jgi:glycosyltransferase involved in cell wall biosynthesis